MQIDLATNCFVHHLEVYDIKIVASSQCPTVATQVGTLLIGTPLAWFVPLLERKLPWLEDFNSFTKEFRACFGDTNSVRKTIISDPHGILHVCKDGNQGYLPHNVCMHLNSCLNKGHEGGKMIIYVFHEHLNVINCLIRDANYYVNDSSK